MHRLAAALAAAALACWALYRCLVRLQRHRLIADTASGRIRSVAQGYVKLRGRALPAGAEPSRAPLSGRPCVWWSYEIQRDDEDEDQRPRWHTVESGASVELFALADEEEARCLVGPVRAEITPTTRNVWYGALSRPSGPPPLLTPPLRYGGYRYSESLLEVGAMLWVMGELRSHAEGSDAERATLERLRQWKADQPALLARFDANHDGRIDASEWETARRAAYQEAQQATPVRTSIISQPSNGEPFLIAPLTSERLVRRELWFALAYFLLALAGVVLLGFLLTEPP